MNDTPMNRRRFFKVIGASVISLGLPGLSGCMSGTYDKTTANKSNILFIIVDDLRPQLNCYGKSQMVTPNIDRIASNGVVFSRAYCQVPVCGASRASLFTGIRPARNRFKNYYNISNQFCKK